MSENSLEAQPRCAKANTHPAQVLLDGKQKCHTTTKKAANDKAKATQELEEATNAWKNQEAAIAQISNLKDTIQQEDWAYPNIISQKPTQEATCKIESTPSNNSDGEKESHDSKAKGEVLKEHCQRWSLCVHWQSSTWSWLITYCQRKW